MYQYRAKVTEVYDGDTCTAEIDCGFNITFTEKIRLYGINAPEMKGADKAKGTITRDKLRELILGKDVLITTIKDDKKEKYGRYLGIITVEIDGKKVIVNDFLAVNGFAERKKYD
jgi:micrococcal nuclease